MNGPSVADRAPDDGAVAVSLLSDAEVVAVRVFRAEPDRAYAAFVEPALLARWWGPSGWRTVVDEIDARVGGRYRIRLLGPDGEVHYRQGEYLEVVPGRRLVRTLEFGEFPGLSVVEAIEFVAVAEGTRITLRTTFPTPVDPTALTAASVQRGVRSLFGRLGDVLERTRAAGR